MIVFFFRGKNPFARKVAPEISADPNATAGLTTMGAPPAEA